MAQFQSANTVDSLDLEEEEETWIQMKITPMIPPSFFSHDVTFNKHPEEVGEVEIAEQYVQDTVEGWQPVSDVLPFNPSEKRILK